MTFLVPKLCCFFRSNKETISLLQGQLFVAETSLGALQGKLDRFQVETSDQLAVILTKQDDMTADLAALTANFTGYKSKTDSTTAEINVNLDSIRLSHAKALTDMSSGFNSTLKNLVTRTEANRKNIDLKHETVQDKFESSFNNLKTQTLQYISSANSQLETVGRNLEAVSKDVENVNNSVQAVGQKVVEVKEQVEDVTTEAAGNKMSIQRLETFQSEMTGNVKMLKAEIVGSAEILTQELARSLETTVKHVVADDIKALRKINVTKYYSKLLFQVFS